MVRGDIEWKSRQRREELQKVVCYRCGLVRPIVEMVEVGYEVYRCAGRCGENRKESER